MKLSVNILTWNTLDTLLETLDILKKELERVSHEIIVVDNGSTDGSQNYATIRNEKNLGISKGKNQGIEASAGKYILLLDGDVVPVPNSIQCLLDAMEANHEIKALGFYPNKWSNQKNKNGQKHHEEYCERLFEIKEFNAHCCYYGIYHRSVFEAGVKFDENYGPGYGWEDLDMYNEMKARGIKQFICHINHPAGKYYHAINSSIKNKDCLGFQEYMRTSKERGRYFANKWNRQDLAVYA